MLTRHLLNEFLYFIEIEAVGQFLFEEYQNLVFGVRTEWLVRKSILRAKFVKYIQNAKTEFRQRLLEANGTYDVRFYKFAHSFINIHIYTIISYTIYIICRYSL